METEICETIGVNIKDELFDLDMSEVILPLSDDEDPGMWLPKEVADKFTDDQIGRWLLAQFPSRPQTIGGRFYLTGIQLFHSFMEKPMISVCQA